MTAWEKGSSSVKEPVTITSDIEQRNQRSQNNRENEHNSEKTKKNFTGTYTRLNPGKVSRNLATTLIHLMISFHSALKQFCKKQKH